MRQVFDQLLLTTDGQRLYEITDRVRSWVAAQEIAAGLLTLYLHHTSASLLIQENADRGRPARPQRLLLSHRARRAAPLPAHPGRLGRHAGAHPRRAHHHASVDPGDRGPAGPRPLAGHLPVRAPRPRPRAPHHPAPDRRVSGRRSRTLQADRSADYGSIQDDLTPVPHGPPLRAARQSVHRQGSGSHPVYICGPWPGRA